MEVFGSSLMSPAPVGPVENSFRRRRSLPHQPPEQSAHFRDRQRKELSGFVLLNLGPLFCPATLATVKKARANIAKVICRYQPCQWRTSYSSNPTCCLANSKASSTCQRLPATRTTCCEVADSGAKTK